MSEWNDHPVIADSKSLAQIAAKVDELDTQALTEYAASLGVTPPDDRPGWSIVEGYGPDLAQAGLYWAGPDG